MQDTDGIYGGFAEVYDIFMDNVSYDAWYQYMQRLLEKHGAEEGRILELACGTGEITRRLLDTGYQVVGVDLSEEMLAIAREKCGEKALFLHQDMRALELFSSDRFDAAVCIGDGINYLDNIEELEQVFKNVAGYLKTGGVFIFDLKTDYYFREIVGNRTITDNRENASYIWENQYDEKAFRNEYLLTVYRLVDDQKDLFIRTDEIHYQQVFLIEAVVKALERQGFFMEKAYHAFSEDEPMKTSERIYVAAKRR